LRPFGSAKNASADAECTEQKAQPWWCIGQKLVEKESRAPSRVGGIGIFLLLEKV